MLSMGKSTISTGPFSIADCNKLPEGRSMDGHQPIGSAALLGRTAEP